MRAVVALLLARASLGGTALRTLPEETLRALRPFVERGEMALIESKKDGTLKQITLVALVRAPRATVWKALASTERYPEFVPNVVKSETIRQEGNVRFVDWEFEVPMFNVEGTNRYTFRPPDAMEAEAVAGDIRTAALRWELRESGADTLVALYSYSDLRDLNFFLRRMIKFNKKMEHGSVLSASLVFMKSLKALVEGRGGRASRPAGGADGRIELRTIRGDAALDFGAVEPLLDRGTAALIQSRPDGRLRQVVLLMRAHVGRDRLYDVVAHPDRYDDFMPQIEEATAISDDGTRLVWRAEVAAPLFDLEYTARTVRGADGVRTDATDGDLKNARWAWEFVPQRPDRTLALYYANADLRRNSWVVRQMVKREPFYEHGVNVASALVNASLVLGYAEGWIRGHSNPRKSP